MLYNKEKEVNLLALYEAVETIKENLYIELYEGDIVIGKFITWYETDNDLDEDDSKYEEYNAGAIQIIQIVKRVTRIHDMTKLYEVTYKNIPKVIKKMDGSTIFQN